MKKYILLIFNLILPIYIFCQTPKNIDDLIKLINQDKVKISLIGDFPICNNCELVLSKKDGTLLNNYFKVYGFTISNYTRVESGIINREWAKYIDSCLSHKKHIELETISINLAVWKEIPIMPQIRYSLSREDILTNP